MATAIDSHDGSSGDPKPFKVEQRGIDFVPESERWATPRNIARPVGRHVHKRGVLHLRRALDGLRLQFLYGPRRSSSSAISRIFLLGLASLQGPETGTTAFTISRAPFGTRVTPGQFLQLDYPVGF